MMSRCHPRYYHITQLCITNSAAPQSASRPPYLSITYAARYNFGLTLDAPLDSPMVIYRRSLPSPRFTVLVLFKTSQHTGESMYRRQRCTYKGNIDSRRIESVREKLARLHTLLDSPMEVASIPAFYRILVPFKASQHTGESKVPEVTMDIQR